MKLAVMFCLVLSALLGMKQSVELEMTISFDDATESFRIEDVEGATAEFLTVIDDTTGSAVWGLAAEGLDHYEPVDLAVGEQRSGAAGGRVQSPTVRATNERGRRIASLTYGVAPPGFQQVFPPTAAPAPLVGGRQYRLLVFGAADATALFSKR